HARVDVVAAGGREADYEADGLALVEVALRLRRSGIEPGEDERQEKGRTGEHGGFSFFMDAEQGTYANGMPAGPREQWGAVAQRGGPLFQIETERDALDRGRARTDGLDRGGHASVAAEQAVGERNDASVGHGGRRSHADRL